MQSQSHQIFNFQDVSRRGTKSITLPSTTELKKALLTLTSATILSLAMANPALAQNNDVDAYDGTQDVGCTAETAIGSTPTDGRSGNQIGGQRICIENNACLLYTSPSPRDATLSRMPSSA